MTENFSDANGHSYDNDRFTGTRSRSIPAMDQNTGQNIANDGNFKMSFSEIPNDRQNPLTGRDNSVASNNILRSPLLLVTNADKSSQKDTSEHFDTSTEFGSLPKTVTTSASKELLLLNGSPHLSATEPKKAKPKKPNRESLRRSRPDIRASHPNLPVSDITSAILHSSPDRDVTVPSVTTLPSHDYEELNTDIVQPVPQQQTTPLSQPRLVELEFSPQDQQFPAFFERARNPRQRMNPMYATMHADPYGQESSSIESKNNRLSNRRLGCVVVGVVFAVILSVLSLAAVTLLLVGYYEPITVFGSDRQTTENQLIQQLQQEISILKNNSNFTQTQISQRLSEAKDELLNAVKSSNFSTIEGMDSANIAKCDYESFEIGSSPTRDKITSGEYFAEEGFVTTGVTCSASIGYIPYLTVKEEEYYDEEGDAGKKTRIIYNCVCHKTTDMNVEPTRQRVACRIHYWQCPIS